MAQSLASSHAAAAAAAGAKAPGGRPNPNKAKKLKKGVDPRAAALAAEMAKRAARKQQRGAGPRRGMVVVGTVFGRDTQGPTALQALRAGRAALP
jgi:hypothetical protein